MPNTHFWDMVLDCAPLQIRDLVAISALRGGCSCARLFWSECGKMRTGVTPNADTFHLVLISLDNSWDNQVTYFYIIYIVPNLLVENQNIELKHRRIMIFKENKKKQEKITNLPTAIRFTFLYLNYKLKGTLMQIWKSPCMLVFMEK